jgi:nitroreductase
MSPPTAGEITSETIRVLENRVSVRKYSDAPVTDAEVEAVLRAAFRAPTSSNIQAYSVVTVRDRETLKKLSAVTGNQRHVAETPVFLAFCADLTRIEHAMQARGHTIEDNNLEVGLVSSIDAALVGMSAYLVADSLGLKGVMIGAVRNDAVEIAKILGLPKFVYCVFGMCLGWPAEAPPQKPRMDFDTVVHKEQYQTDKLEKDLAAYDSDLAAHYTDTGKATTPDSWSHDVDKKFGVQPREKLRAALKSLGFDFR